MDNSTKIAWGLTLCGVAAMVLLKRREDTQSYSHYAENYTSMLNDLKLSRGYRNNNPLNINYYDSYGNMANDWKGQIGVEPSGRFAQFMTMEHGYRAALISMRTKIGRGLNTIGSIINSWAPAKDGNNPVAYTNRVCSIINGTFGGEVAADTIVSRSDKDLLCAMAYAMSIVENDDALHREYNHAQGLPNMETIKLGWEII